MQRKGTYISVWRPTKVLEIAPFALNVEDCAWGGCSKSQRQSNDNKPFIFSNENRETGLLPCVAPGEGESRRHFTGTMLPAGGAEECVVYRNGGPVPASRLVSAFLGFFVFLFFFHFLVFIECFALASSLCLFSFPQLSLPLS